MRVTFSTSLSALSSVMLPMVVSVLTKPRSMPSSRTFYSKQHALYQALKAFGQVPKSLFILQVTFVGI
jgi:TnpA family transposase